MNIIEKQQESKDISENDDNKIKDMSTSTKEESKDNSDLWTLLKKLTQIIHIFIQMRYNNFI